MRISIHRTRPTERTRQELQVDPDDKFAVINKKCGDRLFINNYEVEMHGYLTLIIYDDVCIITSIDGKAMFIDRFGEAVVCDTPCVRTIYGQAYVVKGYQGMVDVLPHE